MIFVTSIVLVQVAPREWALACLQTQHVNNFSLVNCLSANGKGRSLLLPLSRWKLAAKLGVSPKLAVKYYVCHFRLHIKNILQL